MVGCERKDLGALDLQGQTLDWLVIDLVKLNIEVLDCDWYQIKEKELHTHLEPVAKLIPVLMQFSVELRVRHTVDVPNPFTISRTVKIPKNEASGDCGVYVIRTLQLVAEGVQTFESVNDNYIAPYRQYLGLSIQRHAL